MSEENTGETSLMVTNKVNNNDEVSRREITHTATEDSWVEVKRKKAASPGPECSTTSHHTYKKMLMKSISGRRQLRIWVMQVDLQSPKRRSSGFKKGTSATSNL